MSSSTESLIELPYWWRLTKYDPACRDARGAFTRATWTSIAHIGHEFDGVVLTKSEYERVENAYVCAFALFARDSGVDVLVVRDFEFGEGLEDGLELSIDNAKAVVRRLLREQAFCRFESRTRSFVIHVGFDLYMYIGSVAPCQEAQRRAATLGLFVEPDYVSPYVK